MHDRSGADGWQRKALVAVDRHSPMNRWVERNRVTPEKANLMFWPIVSSFVVAAQNEMSARERIDFGLRRLQFIENELYGGRVQTFVVVQVKNPIVGGQPHGLGS